MKLVTAAVVLAAVASCSSSKSNPDAAKTGDAPRAIDAKLVDAKVFEDAPIPSTVKIVPNCTDVAVGDIAVTITTTADDKFDMPTPPEFAPGKYVKFVSTGSHNFANQPGAAANAVFRSGDTEPGTTCLQFTAAGTFPFECELHASMGMTGTVTVN